MSHPTNRRERFLAGMYHGVRRYVNTVHSTRLEGHTLKFEGLDLQRRLRHGGIEHQSCNPRNYGGGPTMQERRFSEAGEEYAWLIQAKGQSVMPSIIAETPERLQQAEDEDFYAEQCFEPWAEQDYYDDCYDRGYQEEMFQIINLKLEIKLESRYEVIRLLQGVIYNLESAEVLQSHNLRNSYGEGCGSVKYTTEDDWKSPCPTCGSTDY